MKEKSDVLKNFVTFGFEFLFKKRKTFRIGEFSEIRLSESAREEFPEELLLSAFKVLTKTKRNAIVLIRRKKLDQMIFMTPLNLGRMKKSNHVN